MKLVASWQAHWLFESAQRDFRKLWVAQSISLVGSQISMVALPLIAIYTLGAGTAEVGYLGAAEQAPFLVFGLLAGVLVDRWRHRTVLLVADWARAVAMALIPVAAFTNVLDVRLLYLVAFVVGIGTVFFDVAHQSILTSVVPRHGLLNANRMLESSRAVAQVSGPGLAAVLLKVVSLPFAVVADALSFAISAVFLHSMRSTEPEQPGPSRSTSIRQELVVGLRFIGRTSFLRWNVVIAASWNLLLQALITVFFVYLSRELGLSASTVAAVVFVGSLGGFLGVLVMGKINTWFGLGPGIAVATCASAVGGLLLTVANGSSVWSVVVVGGGYLIMNLGFPLFDVNVASIRQAITPHELMGRTTAAMRFLVWGTLPVGALLGGFLGEILGTRTTIIAIGFSLLVPAALALISPIRRIRDLSGFALAENAEGAENVQDTEKVRPSTD